MIGNGLRELSKSLTLTGAKNPGLVSPGGGDQAQRYHSASVSSESGDSLRHLDAKTVKQSLKYGDAEFVRGRRPRPCYGKFLIKLAL